MKACKKCKSRNQESARFCYQCGTKLGDALLHRPSFSPIPQSLKKKKVIPALDIQENLSHPSQNKEDIITSKNLGRQVSPQLQELLNSKKGLKKTSPENVQNRIPKDKLPAPKNLHNTAAIDKKDLHPATDKALKILLDRKSSAAPGNTPVGNRLITKPSNQNKAIEAKGSIVKEKPKVKRQPLLSDQDRLALQAEVQKSKALGVKLEKDPFTLHKSKNSEKKKEALELQKQRKSQLKKDLAYLDQIFPEEGKTTQASRKKEAPKTTQTKSVDKVSELKALLSQTPVQKKSLSLNKVPQTQEIKEPEQVVQEKTPIKLLTQEPVDPPVQGSSNPSHSEIDSKTWLSKQDQKGPKSPSERLKRIQGQESSEFITPFLTVAAFAYFCYVLYI